MDENNVAKTTNSEMGDEEKEEQQSLKEKLQRKLLERTQSNRATSIANKKTKKDLEKVIRAEIKYYDGEGIKGKYLSVVHRLLKLKTVRSTSVEAERAFSAAGFLLTKLRSLLSDYSIDNMYF